MFSKLRFVKNVRRTVSYNEKKLDLGEAKCLLAENFIKDLDQLSFKDKVERLQQRTSLNERAKKKTLHLILSFSDKEKISDELMKSLAIRYMENAGMAEQPYLVYRHYDSAQPHLHVVGANIRADGSRINVSPGRLHEITQKIREWENEFSLLRCERAVTIMEEKNNAHNVQKVVHGQRSLQRSISAVLHFVADEFKYTSLSEFNVALHLYNVRVTRGREGSRLYQNRGLLYFATNGRGVQVSKSIKASDFFSKPTLDNLEKKFALNQSIHESHRLRFTVAIDGIFIRQTPDLTTLRAALQRERITTIVQRNKFGQPQNIWYIDQQTLCVFDGAVLGSGYTMQALEQRCVSEQVYKEQELQRRLRQQEQQQAHRRGLDYELSL